MALLHNRFVPRPLAQAFAILVGAAVLSPAAHAQSPVPDPPVCLGFTFGPWTPKLDWRAAGHGEPVDTSRLLHAPMGRDWAVTAELGAHKADSLMILFPAFWPAGVIVDLPTRAPAPGDTIIGIAHAFVANGQKTVPASRVRAWRVACSH